ncbi:hypothetical protein [Frigidibacter mobilis]|uniref:Uncharacterized protein n=1 Tax=Frigidibacter mobilis TaxID=1335048 RepID=A0A159YYJ8_9RHOB|nr:hypothetical protein [Frigidibacter mobilis]AMY67572.1 hypothetical protein AKL17_0310 [Frigidibacter mobilis]
MLIDIISLIALGAAIAGIYVAVNRMTGRRLPRWLLPASLGAAMISFAVWNEYTWYARVTAALPDSVEVVLPVKESSFWRPWSYAVPMVTRFIAVDRAAVQRSEEAPGLVRTNAILVQRWTATQRVPVAFDCAAGRRADLAAGAQLAADGTLTGGAWVMLPPDDPFMMAACQGG